jgi:5-methylcytosine-specific restriction endonuclease McrA
VFQRDNGVCNWCNKKHGGWQVDHIRPLVEQKGKSIEELDFTYWELDNLQTLCYSCHHEKSGRESTGRAVKRKTKNAIRWKSFREVFGA